jgi:hypothetical protein
MNYEKYFWLFLVQFHHQLMRLKKEYNVNSKIYDLIIKMKLYHDYHMEHDDDYYYCYDYYYYRYYAYYYVVESIENNVFQNIFVVDHDHQLIV